MDKRYTIFISSTYEDLQSERKRVIESLLQMNCFPVGMEFFNASDDPQWNVIKSLIDEADYYILIIAGRYGSIDNASGLSYTQKEYEYAKSINIPILTFIYEDMSQLPSKWVESDSSLKVKHETFIADAKTRLCKFWKSEENLASQVILGLTHAFKTHPRIGWMRADVETSEQANKEIIQLRKENDELRSRIKQIEETAPVGTESLAQGNDTYSMIVSYPDSNSRKKKLKIEFSWNEVFAYLAPFLFIECSESKLETYFKRFIDAHAGLDDKYYLSFSIEHFQNIKVQLIALGLIAESTKKKTNSNVMAFWSLTPYGKKIMMQLKAIKKQ